MIIKRLRGAQMPSLKRCEADSIVDGEGGMSRKRWKDGERDCSALDVMEDFCGSDGISYAPSVLAGDDMGPSTSSGEVGSGWKTCRVPPRRKRSPVVRVKHSRAYRLPSRFGDSFLMENSRKAKLKPRVIDADFEEECDVANNRACRNAKSMKNSLSPSGLTFLHESSVDFDESVRNVSADKTEQAEDVHSSMNFTVGDVIWAKPEETHPAWPAIVVNPTRRTPESSSKSLITETICVMLCGHSETGDRKYELVKQDMIFPFIDNVDRFQGQTELYGKKPSELRLAIEEAFLAENGFMEMEVDGMDMSRLHTSPPQPFCGDFQEATGSNHDQEILQDSRIYSAVGSDLINPNFYEI